MYGMTELMHTRLCMYYTCMFVQHVIVLMRDCLLYWFATECEHALSLSGLILHDVRSLRRPCTAMTTYSIPLQPPSAFWFDRPDVWGKWKQCFEQFRLASGLSGECSWQTGTSANLYQLVEHCEYSNLRDQMTHDYNVVRIWDSALSKRLPMDPDLTLEKAKKLD